MGMSERSELRISPTQYHLDYLNLDTRHSIEKISQSLKINPNATMCFYGLPGTGKTALAEYLAKELDRPLLAKRASDILSKWVGGSEKNIANMFLEAETEGAILFLDEADSLLRNRETASLSWEVSQVNELLQQMEKFNGIFICATNLFADLDAAALRRFTFKISYKAMTPQQRTRMFVQEALQGDESLLDAYSLSRLNRLDSLVPGDFAVVKRQSRMLGEVVDQEDFLVELEAEYRIKSSKLGRAIGFTT
jgi:SpoVK/Ycf46/Vps4 family AAA+-type ATPase